MTSEIKLAKFDLAGKLVEQEAGARVLILGLPAFSKDIIVANVVVQVNSLRNLYIKNKHSLVDIPKESLEAVKIDEEFITIFSNNYDNIFTPLVLSGDKEEETESGMYILEATDKNEIVKIESIEDMKMNINEMFSESNIRFDDELSDVGTEVMVIEDDMLLYMCREDLIAVGAEGGTNLDELIEIYGNKKAIVRRIELEIMYKCNNCPMDHPADTEIYFPHTEEVFFISNSKLTPYVSINLDDYETK